MTFDDYYCYLYLKDFNSDGVEEIIVDASYHGSSYGAGDIFVYSVTDDGLELILFVDNDNITQFDSEAEASAGCMVEDDKFYLISFYFDPEDNYRKSHKQIEVEWVDGVWRVVSISKR